MKRFYLLATLILCLLLTGCKQDNNESIDCDPPIITFDVIITDADGNLIIQEENGKEKIRELLTIEHCGHTATLNGEMGPYSTDPFYVGYDLNGNLTKIFYGFFSAHKNYKDETFTLKWKDGTQDVVRFSASWKYNESFKKEAFFNGTEITEWGESGVTPIIRKTIK